VLSKEFKRIEKKGHSKKQRKVLRAVTKEWNKIKLERKKGKNNQKREKKIKKIELTSLSIFFFFLIEKKGIRKSKEKY
jgi:hypothetical protein